MTDAESGSANRFPSADLPADHTVSEQELYDWVDQWSLTWFLDDDGQDAFLHRNLTPGLVLRIEVFNLVLPIVQVALGRSPRLIGRGRYRHLKRVGLDRGARSWALRILAAFPDHRGLTVGTGGLAFASELATPSALEPSIAVARQFELSAFSVLAADPRAFRAWQHAGAAPVPMLAPLRTESRLLGDARRAVERAWPTWVERCPAVRLFGRDMTEAIRRAIEPVVFRSIPWLHVEADAIQRYLDRFQPTSLVLASDQHRIGRLITGIARQRGIRTWVLQHGLPQDRVGFVPVAADGLIVWGQHSAEWFVAQGVPWDRLHVVGNPRIDRLAASDRVAMRAGVDQRYGIRGTPRVLLAISAAPDHINQLLVELAVEGCSRRPGASLIVKLHPGGWSLGPATANALRSARSRNLSIRVVEGDPLYPLIHWADAVLLHRSSVAVDALSAGTPVVVADLDGRSIGDLELRSLRLPMAGDAGRVDELVRSLLDDRERQGYLRDRRIELERVLGPTDGRNAERIANLIA